MEHLKTKKAQTIQSNPLICQAHQGLTVTHICLNHTCLIPLCAKCIKEHNALHRDENTFSAIEPIEEVKDMCVTKVKDSMVNFTTELERIEGQASRPIVNTDILRNLHASKRALYEVIDNYYRELEMNLVKSLSVSGMQKNNPQNYKTHGKIRNYLDILEGYYAALQKNQLMKYIKPIVTTDFESELEKIRDFYDGEMQEKSNLEPEVIVNPNILKNFEKLLKSYSQIIEGRAEPPADSFSPSMLKKSSIQKRGFGSSPKKSMNYFDKEIYKRYLHFFQHKSKSLYLLDIDTCERDGNFDFERIEMNIDFKIPRWHRSIVTPFGEIYMTGGVDVEKSDIKLDKAFVYDFNNTTLIEVKSMNCGRSGHALVYLQGYLYAIGGFSHKKEFTRHCERYNIRNDSWEEIGSLNVGSNNPCACSYNDKYIYKFGGKIDDLRLCNYIERYDPLKDKWTIVQYEFIGEPLRGNSNLLLSSSACCQINEKDIFVFGGTHADYSYKSNSSFCLRIEKDPKKDDENSFVYTVRNYNKNPLPVAEGFWNNQAIAVDSKMYCLQNIQNEKNVSIVYLDRRRIMRFQADVGWTILN